MTFQNSSVKLSSQMINAISHRDFGSRNEYDLFYCTEVLHRFSEERLLFPADIIEIVMGVSNCKVLVDIFGAAMVKINVKI